MKPFICNCGAKKGKHKRDHWCEVWAAQGDDDFDAELEDQYNDPRHELRTAMPTLGDLG